MQRISGILLAVTLFAMFAVLVLIRAEQSWAGIQLFKMEAIGWIPQSGQAPPPLMSFDDGISLSPHLFNQLLELHIVLVVGVLALTGAYLGGVAYAQRKRLLSRIAGWNGLAMYFALMGYLVMIYTVPQMRLPLDTLGQTLSLGTFDQDDTGVLFRFGDRHFEILMLTLGTLALLLGIFALISIHHPRLGWLGAFFSTFTLLSFFAPDSTLQAELPVHLMFPLLVIIGVTAFRLSDGDDPASPFLFFAAFVSLVGIIIVMSVMVTLYDALAELLVASMHLIILPLWVGGLAAGIRQRARRVPTGSGIWISCLGLMTATMSIAMALVNLMHDGMPARYPDYPSFFQTGQVIVTLSFAGLVVFAAIAFRRLRAASRAQHAARQ